MSKWNVLMEELLFLPLFIHKFFCIRQENKKSNLCISVLSFLYKFYVCNVVQILIFFCLVVSRINSSKVGILMIITFCPQKSLEAKLTSVTSNIVRQLQIHTQREKTFLFYVFVVVGSSSSMHSEENFEEARGWGQGHIYYTINWVPSIQH